MQLRFRLTPLDEKSFVTFAIETFHNMNDWTNDWTNETFHDEKKNQSSTFHGLAL